MVAVVGGSPIGNLKPGEEEDENDKGAAFQDSLPFHSHVSTGAGTACWSFPLVIVL